jgi:hypothetical protein
MDANRSGDLFPVTGKGQVIISDMVGENVHVQPIQRRRFTPMLAAVVYHALFGL